MEGIGEDLEFGWRIVCCLNFGDVVVVFDSYVCIKVFRILVLYLFLVIVVSFLFYKVEYIFNFSILFYF